MAERWASAAYHSEILSLFGLPANSGHKIQGVSPIVNPRANTLLFSRTWTPDFEALAAQLPTSLFLTTRPYSGTLPNVIAVENPRLEFARISRKYLNSPPASIEPSAVIADTALINETAHIGPFVVIQDGVTIGAQTSIGPHTVIQSGTLIEDRVTIGPHATLGSPGFGYERDEEGIPHKMPHLGGVRIECDVEMGSHVTVNSGVIEATVIKRWAKLGDHVHISHNVQIGERALVVSGSTVCGSAIIGSDAWIAPGSIIKNKVRIGDRSTLGLGSVSLDDVDDDSVVYGVPARPHPKKPLK